MKKISDINFLKELQKRWGVKIKLKNDSSKYGSDNDDDYVANDILGIVTVREVKKAESTGAIVYRDSWRIRTKQIEVTPQNAQLFSRNYPYGTKVNIVSTEFRNLNDKRYRKNINYVARANESIVDKINTKEEIDVDKLF